MKNCILIWSKNNFFPLRYCKRGLEGDDQAPEIRTVEEGEHTGNPATHHFPFFSDSSR